MSVEHKAVKISVVIPAHNEEAYLPACLESLARQDFAFPYEVIVVNNGSTDKTAEVARRLGAIVVDEPHFGITWARQRGLEHSKGEIIACVDADTYVASDWLRQIHEAFSKDKETVG